MKKYRLRNIFNQEELANMDPAELVTIVKDLRNYKQRIFYYGKDLATAKKALNELHKVPATLKNYPAPIKYKELGTGGKVNFVDKFDENKEGLFKFTENFLKKELVDYFIFGHRHVMLNTEIGENSRFILLGDWIKSFSYGVFDGENFELKKYKDLAKS